MLFLRLRQNVYTSRKTDRFQKFLNHLNENKKTKSQIFPKLTPAISNRLETSIPANDTSPFSTSPFRYPKENLITRKRTRPVPPFPGPRGGFPHLMKTRPETGRVKTLSLVSLNAAGSRIEQVFTSRTPTNYCRTRARVETHFPAARKKGNGLLKRFLWQAVAWSRWHGRRWIWTAAPIWRWLRVIRYEAVIQDREYFLKKI